MRSIVALMRASWLEAASYRMRVVFTFVSMAAGTVPLYLVAQALQPMMASSLVKEGDQYFSFLVTGVLVFALTRWAVITLPNEVGTSISNGTMEALLGTPTRLPVLLAGMVGYQFVWTAFRCLVILFFAGFVGVHLYWSRGLVGLGILVLLLVAYLSIGIMSAALIVAFRSAGPLGQGALWASSMLGGVYYPTAVIPSWLKAVSTFLPMTYGLRALRQTMLEPSIAYADVMADVGRLALMTVVLFAGGFCAFVWALRYARRAGSLSQY